MAEEESGEGRGEGGGERGQLGAGAQGGGAPGGGAPGGGAPGGGAPGGGAPGGGAPGGGAPGGVGGPMSPTQLHEMMGGDLLDLDRLLNIKAAAANATAAPPPPPSPPPPHDMPQPSPPPPPAARLPPWLDPAILSLVEEIRQVKAERDAAKEPGGATPAEPLGAMERAGESNEPPPPPPSVTPVCEHPLPTPVFLIHQTPTYGHPLPPPVFLIHQRILSCCWSRLWRKLRRGGVGGVGGDAISR